MVTKEVAGLSRESLHMKVNSEIFKGIEFVQINSLPEDQREKFTASFNRNLIIKILIDGKIISNCVQYSDYEAWFQDSFPSYTQKIMTTNKQAAVVSVE